MLDTPMTSDPSAERQTVARIMQVVSYLDSVWARWRRAGLKVYEYVMGEQIDDATRKLLQQENRPEMVFNKMRSKVVALAGVIEQNHSHLKAVPTRMGDEKGAEMHTVLVSDWGMKGCNGYREMAKAGLDASLCGIGWLNNHYSFKNDPEGRWVTETADPFTILMDPLTRKEDGSDCKYYAVTAFYTLEEILGIYKNKLQPDVVKRMREEDSRISTQQRTDDKPKSWVDRITGSVTNWWRNTSESTTLIDRSAVTQWVDVRNGVYRVVEFHDRRAQSDKVMYTPQTRDIKLLPKKQKEQPDEEYDAMVEQMQMQTGGIPLDIDSEQLWLTVICPTLLPDRVLLEQPYAVQERGFQHKMVLCYNFHPDITKTTPIFDVLIDPANSYNQRRMSMLEMVMDMVHPNWLVKKNSIDPPDLDDWKSKARGVLKYWKGDAPPTAQYPAPGALQALKMLADDDAALTDELAGITPNVQGVSDTANESGALYQSRVRQSMTMMAHFMGNLTSAMVQVFSYCDASLQKFMTFQRAVRILDEKNNPQWLQLNVQTVMGVLNDVKEGEYDFVVDTTQIGQTAKDLQLSLVTNMLQVIPPDLVNWSKVIKMLDLADADEMAAYAQQMMDMKMQGAQQAMAMKAQQDKLALMAQTASTMGAMDQAATPAAPPTQ